MPRKALIIANTGRFIALFESDNIKILKDLGFEVHCFASFDEKNSESFYGDLEDRGVHLHNVQSFRSPFRLENFKVYFQLRSAMLENKFDFVDCHTPMGGVLARLAAKATGTHPVQYTAHGFHFYRGAPVQNWLFYYPVERFLSRFTDTLITINCEDFRRAKTFHAKRVIQIPGVGVDVEKYRGIQVDVGRKRREIGVPAKAFLIVSVGELNRNKNHQAIIRAISGITGFRPYYLLCGEGPERKRLEKLCENAGIRNRVIFLGFRSDIAEILKCSDCFAFPSRREGLGVAALEAMASGLPLITSGATGISEYSEDGKTGFVCEPDDVSGFSRAILRLMQDGKLREQMGRHNQQAAEKFGIRHVNRMMTEIYRQLL